MQALRDQHVLILGLGLSGLAMARWCTRHGAIVTVADTREAPPQAAVLQRDCPQARLVCGPLGAQLLEGQPIRMVLRSPGLSPAQHAPVTDAARALGLWQGGELSLFAMALRDLQAQHGYAPKVLAITGTNGKTTVTSLTGQLLERAGWRVKVAGNIGPTLLDMLAQALDEAPALAAQPQADAPELDGDRPADAVAPALALAEDAAAPDTPAPALDAAPETPAAADADASPDADDAPAPVLVPPPPAPVDLGLPQAWVLELSSFQLDACDDFEPTAAVVLNLTQDHLDWHGSLAAYGQAKARIFGQQALMVLNREDPLVMAMLPAPVRVRLQKPQLRAHVCFGADMPQRPGDWGIERVNGTSWLVRALPADETIKRRRGEAEDLFLQRLMPADALRIRGLHNATNALAALALASSTGAPLGPMLYGLREYRGEPHRVEPVAIVHEVEYFDDSKGTNVGATVAALRGLGAERRVVVILGGDGKGQDFAPLADAVAQHARAVVLIGRDGPAIGQALAGTEVPQHQASDMAQAVQIASEQARSGDAVLMSPACASFDMFRDYGHRAEVFRQAVVDLAERAGLTLEGA